jgi:hypothetical protein
VWDTPRTYNHQRLITGRFSGVHVCGTEQDFRQGATAPADPPMTFDSSGLPTCCGVNTVTRYLPFAFGIKSTVTTAPAPPHYLRFRFAIASQFWTSTHTEIHTSMRFSYAIASEVDTQPVQSVVRFRFSLFSMIQNATCGGADNIVLNQFVGIYTRLRVVGQNDQWYRIVKPGGSSPVYCIATYNGPLPHVEFHVYIGACHELEELVLTPSGPRCFDFTIPPDAPFYIRCIISGPFTTDTDGIRILAGTCVHNGFTP